MIDEHGRVDYLRITTVHRPECRFGPGFFRLSYGTHDVRYCQSQDEVTSARRLLEGVVREITIERDGYCLDGDPLIGDANTPDVVDGDWWLGLSVADGMRELGLSAESDYRRAYHAIEAAAYRRDNRAAQGGVRASLVIKRPGAKVIDVGASG
jgi:hypothetical protein